MQINAVNLFTNVVRNLRARVGVLKNKLEETRAAGIQDLHSPGGLKEKCGVFGYFSTNGDKNICEILSKSMQRLVHRGDKAAGCVYYSDGQPKNDPKVWTKESDPDNPDPVNQLLTKELIERAAPGSHALGHTLYTTSRTKSGTTHMQPIKEQIGNESMFLVHNGNLPDCTKLKAELVKNKVDIEDCNDSKLIAKAIAHYANKYNVTLEEAVRRVLNEKWFPQAAYALLIMTRGKIIAVRDRIGSKPLALGKTGNGIILASESAPFKPIRGEIIRDIRPGEMLIIDGQTKIEDLAKEPEPYSRNQGTIPRSSIIFPKTKDKLSSYEDMYFSRPDSIRNGRSVHHTRMDLGKTLAQTFQTIHPDLLEGKNKIDYVVPIPESGRSAAEAFASELKIPLNSALIKNKHQRTFISERGREINEREKRVEEKFSVIDDVVKGKNILLVDDSLVRSTTIKVLERMFRDAGAKSVHFAIPAPPVLYPNFFGTDVATQKELYAPKFESDVELAKRLNLDSITFLRIKDFVKAVNTGVDTSDFDGIYPAPIGKRRHEFKKNLAFNLLQGL